MLGATPVFVDVDPRTFQIDPAHLARRIAEVRAAGRLRPRALIGVDLFGQPADWPALNGDRRARRPVHARRPARRASAPACTARKLGTQAQATATSFFPSASRSAPMATAARCSPTSDERAALYRSLRTHGEGTTRYEVLRTGMNGRLDTLQAAVLLAKLDVFDDELAAPRADRRHSTTGGSATCVDGAGAGAGQQRAPGRSTRCCCATRRSAPRCRRRCAQQGVPTRDLLSAPAAPAARLSRPP